MSKDKISDYSATANSNTDIGGINIDEGCAPSGINDAIRTLMKQLKDWQSGSQDVYIHPAGSASVPSITATGDTNTGIFFPAADTIALTTGGSERLRLDSSGNFGIGTTSPANYANYKTLTVQAPSGGTGAEIDLKNSSGTTVGAIYSTATDFVIASDFTNAIANSILRFDVDGAERMRIDANGKLLVGGTTSDLSSTTQAMIMGSGGLAVQYTGTTGTLLQIVPGAANGTVDIKADARSGSYPAMTFYTSATERARIDSSGNLLVGVTSASAQGGLTIYPTGSSGGPLLVWNRASTTNITTAADFRNAGTSVGNINFNNTSTSYVTSSDYRLKENIQPMTGALAKVAALKPCTYKWKADGSAGEGFIAHELAEVCPSAVTGEKDAVDADGNPQYQGIDTSFLVATLTAAIKEQQALIESLTARITALEAK